MDYIRARRRAGATWREISDDLAGRGVTASPSNICEVFRRTMSRKKWPAGMEPVSQTGTDSQAAKTPAQDGPPKPFRSRLNPHLAFIQAQRKDGQSWRQIADDLAARGVRVSFQAVADFHSRTVAREVRRQGETPADEPIQSQPAQQAETPAARPPLPRPQAQEPSQGGSLFTTKKTGQPAQRPQPGRTPPPDPLASLD